MREWKMKVELVVWFKKTLYLVVVSSIVFQSLALEL